MPRPEPATVGEKLFWSYANLAMAHVALKDGAVKYSVKHFGIRARLYAGLRKGTMAVRSLFDDEREKLAQGPRCSYCGAADRLSVDHIFPRLKGGRDAADNLLPACRSCNASKGARDLLDWMRGRDAFPTLFVYRRYLKLALAEAEAAGLMHAPLAALPEDALPFDPAALPGKPPLDRLRLAWG